MIFSARKTCSLTALLFIALIIALPAASENANANGGIQKTAPVVQEISKKILFGIETKARQGDTSAEVRLGEMYYHGFDSKRGQISQTELEELNSSDWSRTRNYTKAIKWFRDAAKSGNSTAEYMLGRIYLNGQGEMADTGQATRWFRLAANGGNAAAQYRLGMAYASGFGEDQSYQEALKYFTTAADGGNADAAYQIGASYEYGHGVTTNCAEAVQWFTKSARRGNVDAPRRLGDIYAGINDGGTCNEHNDAIAYAWLSMGAAAGNDLASIQLHQLKGKMSSAQIAEAKNTIAKLPRAPILGGMNDFQIYTHVLSRQSSRDSAVLEFIVAGNAEALAKLTKEANSGDVAAQLALGGLYSHRLTRYPPPSADVEPDDQAAFHWFSMAADKGNPQAEYILGQIYAFGQGVKQDHKEAFSWWLKAAAQKEISAEYMVGESYRYGVGVEKDLSKATAWLRKAAEGGNSDAQRAIGEMFYKGSGADRDYLKAYFWLFLAANTDPSTAALPVDSYGIDRLLTPAQIADVRRAAENWQLSAVADYAP